MGKLDGRVVIVSGAARGQGAAEARLFVAEGARVVLGDVLEEQGASLAEELGEAAAYVPLDVRDEGSWQRAVRVAESRFGKVDGLVNNAGILRFNELAVTPVEEFREVVDVNQTGCFLGMKTAAPRIEAAGGGTIVNTASYAAMSGMAFLTAYAATKAAIVGMTRVASMELAGRGVRVNAMCPGAIDTPMTNPAKAAENGLGGRGGVSGRDGVNGRRGVGAEGGPGAHGDPGAAVGWPESGPESGSESGAASEPSASRPSGSESGPESGSEALDAYYAKLIPQGRIGRPAEVAKLALFLSCEDSSYVSGQPFVIDGGWLAGVPIV